MKILSLRDLSFGFGGPPLLKNIQFSVGAQDKIALVGRNGVGKSTLLKLIAGQLQPDSGIIEKKQGCRIAYLSQTVPSGGEECVYDIVASGLEKEATMLTNYHSALSAYSTTPDDSHAQRLAAAQQQCDSHNLWQLDTQIQTVISKLGLDANAAFAKLSGGVKRRVLLARALVSGPDLLCLDEPTNHLDIDNILWLEDFIKVFQGAVIVISHDRAFLQNVVGKYAEVTQSALTVFDGDYDTYLKGKAQQEATLEHERTKLSVSLAQEEQWMLYGVTARRKRNQRRVQKLHDLREQKRQWQSARDMSGQINAAERSGKIVMEATRLHYAIGDRVLVEDFTTTILRGDKVALVGPNGVGKTTLVKLLLGELKPGSGHVKQGTRLEIAYFDQLRGQIDPDKTIEEIVGQGLSQVMVNGHSKSIYSYLQDFLFTPERIRQPARMLSGGETNRVLLAKLFLLPANVLVLDEPTNDLDIETLEILETMLTDFQGTLLLVSHDRTFVDNVVTSVIAFEGAGKITEHVGGYSDYLAYASKRKVQATLEEKPKKQKPKTATVQRLSYKEQRELEALPEKIAQLETEQARLQTLTQSADFYQQEPEVIKAELAKLQQVEAAFEAAFARWEMLEARNHE